MSKTAVLKEPTYSSGHGILKSKQNEKQAISKRISLLSVGKFIIQIFEFMKLKYMSKLAIPLKINQEITWWYLSFMPLF